MRWKRCTVQVILCHLQERYSRKTEAADLQRAFTVLDSKGDGKIDAAELGSLFKRLGHKFTRVQHVYSNAESQHPWLCIPYGGLCTFCEHPFQNCFSDHQCLHA